MATGPYDYYDPNTPVEDQPSPPLGDFTIPWMPQTPLGDPSYQGPPIGPSMPPSSPIDPRMRQIANILSLLLLGGGAAGIGQNLFGRPPTTTVQPSMSPQQQSLLGMLLGNIQNPQISPQLSALVERAYQPQLGNLYAQATEAGRQRGFYDAPATSPPGGAIFGPGLAALQGQMAQSKLGLLQNQTQGLQNAFQTLPGGPTQTRAPQPTLLQSLGQAGPLIGGVGQLLAAMNPAQQAGQAGGGIGSWLSGLFNGGG